MKEPLNGCTAFSIAVPSPSRSPHFATFGPAPDIRTSPFMRRPEIEGEERPRHRIRGTGRRPSVEASRECDV